MPAFTRMPVAKHRCYNKSKTGSAASKGSRYQIRTKYWCKIAVCTRAAANMAQERATP